MLYVIYGDDFKKTRESLNSFVNNFIKNKPDSSVVKIDEDNVSDYDPSGFLSGQGLFEKEILVVFDSLLGQKLFSVDLKKILPEMSSSQNTFVFHESFLDKKTEDLFKKEADKIQSFNLVAKNTKIFNPFSLGDALGNKNKKLLWVTFYKALQNNISPEEVHGILFWQIKSILLTKESSGVKESGLNPFVYSKSKNFATKFSSLELKKLSSKLVDIYHGSRAGLYDLEIALEKFILSV